MVLITAHLDILVGQKLDFTNPTIFVAQKFAKGSESVMNTFFWQLKQNASILTRRKKTGMGMLDFFS